MANANEVVSASLGASAPVLWIAAAVSLGLLVLLGMVAEILLSRRRDATVRFLRAALFFAFPALVVAPGIVVTDQYGAGAGLGLFFYMVFFSLFCYYLGRRVGRVQGRSNICELVGLDSADSIEEAQDRLFESRMRFPVRAEVVKSIGEMARVREAARRVEEKGASGGPVPRIDLAAGLPPDRKGL